jgi:DNA polymerase-3 subunit alpha
MSAGFTHLHVHTEYSVLDGASQVKDLIARCQEYGMDACAITDHGAMFGALDFFESAKKAGIKPIIGCELYMAKNNRHERKPRAQGGGHYHFLVLCENEVGYHNLCRLSSIGYLEGFYSKPRVDLEVFAKHKEGLIATSSCLAGEVPQFLMEDKVDEANEAIKKYVELLGPENFLIELQDHGIPEQQKINPILAQMAEDHGLMTIATNDCHYVDKSDAAAHEALLCIQTNAMLDDEKRFKFPSNEFYVTSPDEMKERFAQWPESISNTDKIAQRCNVDIPLGQRLIPNYIPPVGKTQTEYLRELVFDGLDMRYDNKPTQAHIERAEFELNIIETMQFVDYFLVVWDLINYARENEIAVGPGRGSGAGSLVAFALQITNIDPIKYQLLFERFLNPERVSMPDFDLDFCYERRVEVIEYTREKYGNDNVSQIITFGRMLAKQVVRNVGRVLGMSYGDVDRIAKLVPDELKIKLKDALKREPELQRLVKDDPMVKRLWELAERLEGTIGNCGTHAAGVVICDQALTEHVPLFQAAGSDVIATQFEMKGVEEVGLLKMDFLGLRTLTVVHEAVRFVKETHGIEIAIDYITPNDHNAYEVLRSGKTTGIFQLESAGMRDLSKRIGLESLEEICALVALYRPGPMALKDQYIECKHDPSKIRYAHPLLEPILAETYGVALYQEQVMQIVQALAGFTLGGADILRRAMGKKKVELMAEQREKFVKGCKETNDIDAKLAEELFATIEQFAGYGFNKSHSIAYAFVAYQTAFLKANYPVEFMAALLTSESGNLDKVGLYVDECRRTGIEVLPPDVNASCRGFAVDGPAIRFGMGAIKNVGDNAVESLVAEREANGPFKDIFDFCARIDSRSVNRRCIESLNKAGAFTSTGWNRREVEESLDDAMSEGQISSRDRASGQGSLLDLMANDESVTTMHQKPDLVEWPEKEILALEKEMLGLYVSGHPLAEHALRLERFTNVRLQELSELRESAEVIVGGLINQVKHHITQRGKRMAFITLESLDGNCELTVFSDVYERRNELLVQDKCVMIKAKVNYRNGEAGLLADDIMLVEDSEKELTTAVHLTLDAASMDETILKRVAETLGNQSGPCDVYLHCKPSDKEEVTVHTHSAYSVEASPQLRTEIEAILGDDAMWYSGGNGLPQHGQN